MEEAMYGVTINPRGEATDDNGRVYKRYEKRDHNNRIMQAYGVLDGELHGSYIIYHPNGKKMRDMQYDKGKAIGIIVEWHDNGNLSELRPQKDGEDHGLMKRYRQDGTLSLEQWINKGELDGRRVLYHEDGEHIKSVCTFYKGEKIDDEITYRPEKFHGCKILVLLKTIASSPRKKA